MADEKLSALFIANPIDAKPGVLAYGVTDRGTTPASGSFDYSQLMTNRYRIVPSVSSSDLIVAVKHEDGTTDPSAAFPLYFKIANTLRAVTGALTVTKADGTNWANLGSATLGTKEQDLFLYAVWNTNLTPDAVDLFWSRVPLGRRYSDFSATTTAEKYAATGATAPAATDDCICIGRFAATLSLSGTSHVWTVPTFTNINLIQQYIDETREMDFTSTWTNITLGNGTFYGKYYIKARRVLARFGFIYGSSGSAVGAAPSVVFPISPATLGTTFEHFGDVIYRDTGTALYNGTAYLIGGALFPQVSNVAGTYSAPTNLSSAIPMTWASTDEMMIKADYLW